MRIGIRNLNIMVTQCRTLEKSVDKPELSDQFNKI